MLRLTNLLRGRIIPRLATRSGPPGWDRPDPPASVHLQDNHELSDQEIMFYFPDGNMPEFILTQPEVYEGDTLLEATPSLLKGWAVVFGFAFLFGFANWIVLPPKNYNQPYDLIVQLNEKRQKMAADKTWVKWGNQNPLGITLTNDSFPLQKLNMGSTESYDQILINNQKTKNTAKEVKNYLTAVKAKAVATVNKRLAGHHDGHAHSTHEHHSGEAHGETAHLEGGHEAQHASHGEGSHNGHVAAKAEH